MHWFYEGRIEMARHFKEASEVMRILEKGQVATMQNPKLTNEEWKAEINAVSAHSAETIYHSLQQSVSDLKNMVNEFKETQNTKLLEEMEKMAEKIEVWTEVGEIRYYENNLQVLQDKMQLLNETQASRELLSIHQEEFHQMMGIRDSKQQAFWSKMEVKNGMSLEQSTTKVERTLEMAHNIENQASNHLQHNVEFASYAYNMAKNNALPVLYEQNCQRMFETTSQRVQFAKEYTQVKKEMSQTVEMSKQKSAGISH